LGRGWEGAGLKKRKRGIKTPPKGRRTKMVAFMMGPHRAMTMKANLSDRVGGNERFRGKGKGNWWGRNRGERNLGGPKGEGDSGGVRGKRDHTGKGGNGRSQPNHGKEVVEEGGETHQRGKYQELKEGGRWMGHGQRSRRGGKTYRGGFGGS